MDSIAAVREAPAPTPLPVALRDTSHPAEPNNLLLEVDEIQGNILAGFAKDFQTNIYLKITDVKAFRTWLKGLIPLIATTAQVVAFNRLFKALRSRQQRPPRVKATWINIAFSYQAI
jgi:hypothetical protein